MEGHREEAEEIWNKVSLWSVNRGINRFRGLQMALELCGERGWLRGAVVKGPKKSAPCA